MLELHRFLQMVEVFVLFAPFSTLSPVQKHKQRRHYEQAILPLQSPNPNDTKTRQIHCCAICKSLKNIISP